MRTNRRQGATELPAAAEGAARSGALAVAQWSTWRGLRRIVVAPIVRNRSL